MSAEVLRKLELAAQRRRRAEALRRREMRTTEKLLREGVRCEIPILRLANAAGLTRQSVYTILGRRGQR